MKSASIFELSPAEKLQLVEDLWDHLAAEPETVSVHDWQKKELERRKLNLMKNAASVRPWDDVKRRIRVARGRSTGARPEAERDISEAYDWYEGRRAGPGEAFLNSVDACLKGFAGGRRCTVFSENVEHLTTIYAVMHTARDSEKWRRRLWW